jgi:Protein of unknown function (DUF3142)
LKSVENKGAPVASSSAVTLSPKTKSLGVGVAIVGIALGICGHFRPASGFARRPKVAAMASRDRAANGRTGKLPAVIFWAWERPEDLRFLDPQRSGVAFLAKTIDLNPRRVNTSADLQVPFAVRPRLQRLRVAPGTALIAVVRIETSAAGSAPTAWTITPETREAIGSEIAALRNLPDVRAIQIDFDATTNQHGFYSSLLQGVRRQLPPTIPLSITALASWCIGDPWVAQLPPGTIDEAVPMLFRMGPDAANVATFLHLGKEFPVPACQDSLGVSTDEPFSQQLLSKQLSGMPAAWRQKRVYVFSPHIWTPATADSILNEWQP